MVALTPSPWTKREMINKYISVAIINNRLLDIHSISPRSINLRRPWISDSVAHRLFFLGPYQLRRKLLHTELVLQMHRDFWRVSVVMALRNVHPYYLKTMLKKLFNYLFY